MVKVMNPLPKVTEASIHQRAPDGRSGSRHGRDRARSGGSTEWQAYLAELLSHHRRKYSLIPRLEALQR
jgi:hypothetical protein